MSWWRRLWKLHQHDWELVGVQHGHEVYIWGTRGGDVTVLQYRCIDSSCLALRSRQIDGTWTREQIEGR